jgi:hypothetical protein
MSIAMILEVRIPVGPAEWQLTVVTPLRMTS